MSSTVPHPPASPGVTQAERFPAALDSTTAPLDGRTLSELTEFARAFATKLSFWNSNNNHSPQVDWAAFLPKFVEDQFTAAEEAAGKRPQQALFLTFLKLFRHAQGELNNLTERHLEFYYREVLRLTPKEAVPDRTHLILNLKKSSTEARIPAGTVFKSADGLPYRSLEESYSHQTELVHQRLIHRDPADKSLRYAAIANSGDGFGGDFPEDDASWHPFGSERGLDAANIGFALSSPVLLLGEGTRTITITIEIKPTGSLSNSSLETLINSFSAELSGEEEWLPTSLTASVTNTSHGKRKITITLSLTADDPAVVAYDPTVLEGGYDTLAPTVRFQVLGDKHAETAAKLARAKVHQTKIDVAVTGMRNLILENDFGRIDASKPFLPFGPLAKKGSSFYLKAEEALQKNVTNTKIKLNWKEPPEDFKDHYAEYKESESPIIDGHYSFKADLQMLKQGEWSDLATSQNLFNQNTSTKVYSTTTINSSSTNLSQAKLSFKQYTRRISKRVRKASFKLPFSDVSVFKPVASLTRSKAFTFRDKPTVPEKQKSGTLSAGSSSGFLRLRLKQSFLHELFPTLYAQAFASQFDNKDGEDPLPNEPYTPEIDSFSFEYSATSGAMNPSDDSANNYDDRQVRFFHLTPFGQREEHAHIKDSLDNNEPVTLLPRRPYEGELYLGLTNLSPKTSVSLLVQVLDGSSNPLTSRQTIHWSVLSSNHWKEIEGQQILADTTNGFLSSGAVRLLLPGETTDNNTLLEPGFVWLRAHVEEETDGVCRLLAIQPNALTVELDDTTEATHLESALPPESITASESPLPLVKEILQPFASFGGAAPENKTAFRRRTSERLRHRNRAITPWDYERLVLENFPKIYRIQCLSHTNENLDFAPGHVTLVTIPDTRNTAASNSLAPLTEQSTVSKVNDYLLTKNSTFATARAVSADFEPITLTFNVAFRTGYPFTSYRPILNEDIRKHLSPWAYDESLLPDFGGTIYRSTLIAFIESLDYVDYLTEFELRQAGTSDPDKAIQVASPSRPGAILTTAQEHSISDATA